MWDIKVMTAKSYLHMIPAGRTLAALSIIGHGKWTDEKDQSISAVFQHKDFMTLNAESDTKAILEAGEGTELRMILIEVPSQVNYPLYP
jgi:hypothetical protein